MGNRCYLNSELDQIFESNNTLPTFWIMGFSFIHFDEFRPKQYSSKQTTLLTGLIEISPDEFLHNLQIRSAYISNVYPNLLPIYQNFLAIIEFEAYFTDFFELNFKEYLDSFENESEVWELFKNLFYSLISMEKTSWINEQNIVYTTIGSDSYSTHHSSPISEQWRKKFSEKNLRSEQFTQKKRFIFEALKSLTILIISIVLTLASLMILLDSNSRTLGILGSLFFSLCTIISFSDFKTKYLHKKN